jgi:GT2 family glycosyltransferase
VIVPVFRDWRALPSCLQALESQSYTAGGYEVVVVDNEPDGDPDAKLDLARYPHARLVIEEKPGSYSARNRGVAAARGDIFAFTDADCLPRADWIGNAVGLLQKDPEIARVAGRIEIFPLSESSPSSVELYERVFAFQQQTTVETLGAAIGANLIVRRAVVEAIGGFDEGLLSGGDLEWGRRAAEAGFRIVYAPEVRVDHPARASWESIIRKTRRLQGGQWAAGRGWRRASPRLARLRVALTTPRLNGPWERARVVFVLLVLRLVRSLETLRLRLGGRPARA